MTAKRKVCVVTGSRAEYGLLYWVIHDLNCAPDVELQLVVTGQHLAPEFGWTVSVIEQDGFAIAERIEMLLSSDSARGIATSLGLGVIGFAAAYARLQPDIVVLLGDRFEIFAAAQAAMTANIPLAHIAGGDSTEGAFDEAIRHSITKMAHLHFVTNELSARRVRQLGEDPGSIHQVGSPGIDNIRRLQLLDRTALERELGVKLQQRNLLITFHPVTLEPEQSEAQLMQLLAALDCLPAGTALFFTAPNSDTGGRALGASLARWAADRPAAHVFVSLGQQRYLSLMAQADAVVGNSSSGLYEAPALRVPTVDIGDRQRGRLAAASVIRCAPTCVAIQAALAAAFTLDCSNTVNPYGDGHSAARIVEVLRTVAEPRALLKKRFHMMAES
jgi:UDP-hydrolysing UDP-N-acetyl-D-glucosamine 2-epimerase